MPTRGRHTRTKDKFSAPPIACSSTAPPTTSWACCVTNRGRCTARWLVAAVWRLPVELMSLECHGPHDDPFARHKALRVPGAALYAACMATCR